MDEATVFEVLLDRLEREGYEYLVHVPSAHAERYRAVLEQSDTHSITIDGKYPDIIGFTPTNRVFAIEVKGDRDLAKGLGQVNLYRRGSQLTYLAASQTALQGDSVSEIALSHGIGIIEISESGIENWMEPADTQKQDLIGDIRGQLTYRLRHEESAGSITAMKLTQPLNFLAPVLVLDADEPLAEPALRDRIVEDYEYDAVTNLLFGSSVLGLITAGSERQLTTYGQLAATTLKGYGIPDAATLDKVKEEIKGSVVIDKHPVIAALLRTRYESHPEMQVLLEILQQRQNPIEFPALLELLVTQYPNVFLNLFCTNKGRKRARGLLERGERARLYEESEVWHDVVRSNILSNFTQQLKHIGILSPETPSHFGLANYVPEEKPWIPRSQ